MRSMRPRLLVVDDNPAYLENLETILEGWCSVVAASHGREALALAERGRLDGVLTDLSMPGLSGTELISELRRAHPELPAIILSACPQEVPHGFRAEVLDKAMSVPCLVAAVQRVFQCSELG